MRYTQDEVRISQDLPGVKKEILVRVSQYLPGEKEQIFYGVNSYGYRSLFMQSEKKDKRTIRIICLGASTTNQPTQDIEDAWPGILEKELNSAFAKKGIKIEIVSYAQSGWRTWDGYRIFKYELFRLDPDIVINLWGINDLCWYAGPDYSYEGRSERLKKLDDEDHREKGSVKRTWMRRAETALQRYSQTYRRLLRLKKALSLEEKIKAGSVLEWHSKNLPALRKAYNNYPYKEELLRDPDPVVEFKDGLEQLVLCLKERGVETIILGQPVLWKSGMSGEESGALWFYVNSKKGPVRMSSQWLENEMNRYNSLQKELALNAGAQYIPAGLLIPDPGLEYFFDDCHFTDKGNETVAHNLYPFLSAAVEKAIAKRGLAGPAD